MSLGLVSTWLDGWLALATRPNIYAVVEQQNLSIDFFERHKTRGLADFEVLNL